MILPLLLAAAGANPLATDAEVTQLPNGLTVVVDEDHRSDTVSLYLKYRVGSRDEVDAERGCAHLFEHLMFEGSANVPTDMFDTWLTAAGGWNNAYTSTDETVYYMNFPSGALDLALFLESDRMGFLDAGIDDANVSNQQDVVLQERSRGYAEPHGRDWDALMKLVHPEGHPYHVPVIGTVADIRGFSPDAVLDFWRRHYRPQNAVLLVVGAVDRDEAQAQIAHWFSDVPDPGPAAARPGPFTGDRAPAHGMLEDAVDDRTVYLAWPTVPQTHPDAIALHLLEMVLDAGRGTRIADALYYKRSRTTQAGVYAMHSDIDGMFLVYATPRRGSLQGIVKQIDKVLEGLHRKPPTEAELTRARKSVRDGWLDQLESPSGRAALYLDCYEVDGTPNCLDARWQRYAEVTPSDLLRVARTWLAPDARTTLSVVPQGDAGALPNATPVELP